MAPKVAPSVRFRLIDPPLFGLLGLFGMMLTLRLAYFPVGPSDMFAAVLLPLAGLFPQGVLQSIYIGANFVHLLEALYAVYRGFAARGKKSVPSSVIAGYFLQGSIFGYPGIRPLLKQL